MIAARPLTGWGEDATGLVYGRFLSGDWAPEVDRAHSGPLDIAATQGVIGLAALAWVLVILAPRAAGAGASPARSARWPRPASATPSGCSSTSTGRRRPVRSGCWPAPPGRACGRPRREQLRQSDARPAGSGADRLAPTCDRALDRRARAGGGCRLAWRCCRCWRTSGTTRTAPTCRSIVDPLQGRYHWALGPGPRRDRIDVPRPGRRCSWPRRWARADPQLYVDLGDADQRLGRTADAQAAYRMALTIDPYYPAGEPDRLAGMGVPASGCASRGLGRRVGEV